MTAFEVEVALLDNLATGERGLEMTFWDGRIGTVWYATAAEREDALARLGEQCYEPMRGQAA